LIFKPKIDKRVTAVLENVYAHLGFSVFFMLELKVRTRRTDGRTDVKTCNAAC